MKVDIVITRHRNLVQYLHEEGLVPDNVEVIDHASPDAVRGKHVLGVLPHALSCLTASFTEIPLRVPPEARGRELTVEEIRRWAGDPVTYRVTGPASFATDVVELTRRVSTNGRWGIAITGPAGVDIEAAPQEGEMAHLGTVDGLETYRFRPVPGCGRWWLLGGDLEPLAGAAAVFDCSLQSGNSATLVVGGDFFAVRRYGYRRRSSRTEAYHLGREIELPPPVMAALGLIPAEEQPVTDEPPALESPLAAALKQAGLAR